MTKTIPFRGVSVLALAAIGSLLMPVCFAQAPAGGGQTQTPPTQNPGGQQPGGRPQPAPQPNVNQPTQPNPDTMPRQIFLSGSVRLSDGSIPPASVVIERVCAGVVRPEAYTDSKGNFSFIVGGQNAAVFADASVGGDRGFGTTPGGQQTGFNDRSLVGCEIRANLAGFQSDSIMLAFRGALDDPEIGVIHLRRLANVEGYTFSVTTGQAPKDARKAYEKGLASMKKQKWAEAEKELTTAVQVYPKYAVAWYELGRVYQQEKKLDEANNAHLEAIKIDSKFISPYAQLALLAVYLQKWDDVVQYTAQMVKLNPYVNPDIYFYSAVANYNLRKFDTAENHAKEAAKLDVQHKNPKINHLLGLILAQKQEYKGAAENMRTYLKLSPNAPDTAAVLQLLADVEKAGVEQTPGPTPQ